VSSKCIADTGRNPPQREHGLGLRDSIRADRWVLVFVTERWTRSVCTVDEIPEPFVDMPPSALRRMFRADLFGASG